MSDLQAWLCSDYGFGLLFGFLMVGLIPAVATGAYLFNVLEHGRNRTGLAASIVCTMIFFSAWSMGLELSAPSACDAAAKGGQK